MTDLDELLGITPEIREWASRPHPRHCCGRMAPIGFEAGRDTVNLCRNRCCVEERCECGQYMGGHGPAGCRCHDGGPNPVFYARGYTRRMRARRSQR